MNETTTTITCPDAHPLIVTILPLGFVMVLGVRVRMPGATLDIICPICGQAMFYARASASQQSRDCAAAACADYNQKIGLVHDFERSANPLDNR